jgi:hypothetical protein
MKYLMILLTLFLVSCEGKTYEPFKRGDVVTHKSDGNKAVVSYCKATHKGCFVSISTRYTLMFWGLHEIKETGATND